MPSVRHMCCGPGGADECFTVSSWPCKFHLLSKTLNVNMQTKLRALAALQSEFTPFLESLLSQAALDPTNYKTLF